MPSYTNPSSEIITLQGGQCGNQVGLQYWNQLASEHGILPDGSSLPYPEEGKAGRTDRPESYFTLSDSNKFTPRSVLIDLEPSVITKATAALPMFNPRNIHLSENGSGAANNWQHGYSYGLQHQEDIINLIDREVDKCENLSTFQLFHSVAGGTGSGVGSLLLELLSDRYGSKKMINTFLIFPSNEKTSDVVVQPYNTILTLKRLIDYSDATFVFDNDSLNSIENSISGFKNHHDLGKAAAFEGTNKLISHVCATISNPLRFPSYMYSSNESILSTLVPTPQLKFLTTSISPFTSSLNEYDLVLELLNDKYKMNRVHQPIKYISMLNYLLGSNLNQNEIRKGVIKASSRVDFVPWTSASIHVVNGRSPPNFAAPSLQLINGMSVPDLATSPQSPISGIQVSNNTSIINVFNKIVKQYDLLAKRAAYINYYTETNDADERARVLDNFNDCRDSVVGIIEEYKASQTLQFLDDEILNDEDII